MGFVLGFLLICLVIFFVLFGGFRAFFGVLFYFGECMCICVCLCVLVLVFSVFYNLLGLSLGLMEEANNRTSLYSQRMQESG